VILRLKNVGVMKKERKRSHEWSDPEELVKQASTMTGIDFLEGIVKGEIPPPPIAKTLEFYPLHIEKGSVEFEFEPQEFHYNPLGTVHGGVISTLLDTVMGCSLQSVLAAGVAYTTLELKVNFLKAVTVKSGMLKSKGKIIHLGRTTALLEADLRDDAGNIYAHAVSTCMLFTSSK